MSGLREAVLGEAMARWRRPNRVVLAVSADKEGRADITALGWNMRTSGRPPMVAISVGRARYSHQLISEGGEFVFAVPGEDMAEAVLFCGTHSGRDVNKFRETGLTPRPAALVGPPLIEECQVNLECRVAGRLDTGDHTIFVGEVLKAWVSDEEKRNLLTVGHEAGYEFLLEDRGYRFGVIRR